MKVDGARRSLWSGGRPHRGHHAGGRSHRPDTFRWNCLAGG